MKLFISLATAGLLTFLVAPVLASQTTHLYPEAYAGLGQDAYHRIELDNSKSTQLSFRLDGVTIPIQLDQTKSTGTAPTNINFTQAIPGGSISATKGDNSLFGQMHLNNKHYILTTNESGIWAVELPQSGLHFNDCGLDHDHDINQQVKNMDTFPKQGKTAGTIIDVLVLHDQAIADRYPGALLQARIDQYFNVSNQTYANSDIDLAIRAVGIEQVGYDFNNDNLSLRNALQSTLSRGIGSLGLENVPQLYAQSGADLVIFLRTHNIETRGNCGIAFFPVLGNNGFDPTYGINIMADGMSSWSICTDQLMVHEIGHNLSAGHHNWDPTAFGFPADARGFAKVGQFGTVMGSFGTGQPDRFFELDYFSNPNIQCGGGPCGIPGQANNANLLNQFKGPVAGYQTSISNAPIPADFVAILTDSDGDGVLDRDDEFPFDSTETNDTDGDVVGDNADAFPTDPRESSDFDQDGLGDNTDPDGDNDGVLNTSDSFNFNPNETSDSDGDGIGDNADVFEFEATESKDADGDGIGNNADEDDDNDGVTDLDNDKQDLLVISTGNNRMLRFDAQTGLAKGIEVLPNDGVFTFQSDLTYDPNYQRLYFSSASSVKSLDLMNPYTEPKKIIGPFSTPEVSSALQTGFPTALQTNASSDLYFSRLNGNDIRGFSLNENSVSTYTLPFFDDFADGENIIDIERIGNQFYFQGQANSVYQSIGGEFNSEILGNGNYSWLVDPYALVATEAGQLLHSDQGRNQIVITNAATGTNGGIFADITQLGYSNPTGMDITQDGRLLVAVADQNAILQFDLDSQEFLGELVSGFGLYQPHKMVLVPQLADRFHEDENKVIRPNAGSWYNPSSAGRGFNIGIFGDRIQVLWYTYDDMGLPIWYFSADFINGTTYDTELVKTTQVDDSTVTFETIGRLNIEFDNERQATVNWQIGVDSGEEAIEWLQFSGEPEVENYTGLWSRPDSPGWGLAVTTIGEKSITIPFIYDGDGEPRWVISDVTSDLQPLNFNMFTSFSDNLCPTCSGPADGVLVPSGTMTLDLSDDANWSSAVLWADPVPGSWDLDQLELIRISSDPTRPR